MPSAASFTSPDIVPIFGLFGLTRRAIRVASGTRSRSKPNRFPLSPAVRILMPVAFPPGWLRLLARPSLIGSSPAMKTMGIVAVACFAANEEGRGLAAMTATANQVGRQFRQVVVATLRPTVLDH